MTALSTPIRTRASLTVPVALIGTTALCWAYLVLLSARMGAMGSPLAMPMTAAWTRADVLLMWTMWAVMMAGMMIPSAAPMIRSYATTIRSERTPHHGSTPLFVTGYLVAWAGFAVAATAVQWLLHDLALVNAMGTSTSQWLAGLLLVAAGAYQFTALKDRCLSKCRTPLGFLLGSWRDGNTGALILGMHHGSLCIGCCWALMALLFVLGVMNLWWIALVSAVVLLEKVTASRAPTQLLGLGLLGWGAMTLVGVA
jgi:predicted metal-binding membrane protein